MHKYTFTNKALQDLALIWDYTFEKWSENQADRYYRMLIKSCREVAVNPEQGKDYSGVTNNLLGLRAGRHIIFYRRITGNDVEITRILHEQMDIKKRIRNK